VSEILRVENLTHIYGIGTPFEKTAIDDVTISVEKGEFLGIIGHTGSGKSTLIQHLNGLLKPTSGKVFVAGKDIWQDPKEIRNACFKVGLVFQYPEYQLFEETVFKDIAFGPRNMGLSEDETESRVIEAVDFVGLSHDELKKSPFEISGGEKRRVAIAGIIAMRPDVLILDEPTAGLDPYGRDEILSHLIEYHESRGTTVMLVTHNMEDMARTVSRAIVINQAKVMMSGTPEQVFARADELFEVGLTVPQITRVFVELKNKGVDIGRPIYTVESAKEAILQRKGGGMGAS